MKNIALITGVNGFVGPYLRKELESDEYDVYGFDLNAGNKVFRCDITDFNSVFSVIKELKPDVIFHLAAFSSVGKSFEDPKKCFDVNVLGTKNLLDAVMKCGIRPKILIVSSSEIYGVPVYLPIDEVHPLNPVSPYGMSRLEQERLCKNYDLPIIIVRSFNHTGENQPETFVIPSFKKQVMDAKEGDTIYVGDIDVVRDFSDVKDVVKAYVALVEKGVIGEVYNVGSGNRYLLRDILYAFIKKSGKNLKIETDPSKYRKAEIKEQVCNPKKLHTIYPHEFKKMSWSLS
jgi:GDP-4-dehydro-6-deoxy-D-mannose reductase